MNRVVAGTLAALAGWTGVVQVRAGSAGAAPRAAVSTAFSAPVYAGDFPDPAVLLVGGTYYAYSTGSAGRNLQVMSSNDLANWGPVADPLPALPTWAQGGLTWAPSVIQLGTVFVMYYTVHWPVPAGSSGYQCISVATSSSPGGAFRDSSTGPLVCQTTNGGSIDPNVYRDQASGGLYLLWKSDDNAIGHTTHLWGEPLASNGLSLAPRTSASLLLTQSASWQAPAIEGPTIVRSGGLYYLFYSANNYDSATSGIGYATARSLLGSYGNQSKVKAWLGTTGNAQGPQGPMVFVDTAGATRMAFAAWDGTVGYENGGVRSLWVGTLTFNRLGNPVLS